ncbi:MAG: hypothetical protein P8L24_05425 [Cytophagales bacterium]|mgnify:CR=1 FL=1|jgi:hypothetical protein|nr:hypothetical protein [Cytophagales bacterium]
MKKVIFVLFIINLTLINNLFSQNKFSFGFKSSYSSSNINFYNNFFPQNIKTNSLNTFDYSFVAEIKNLKKTGIRIEISKKTKGWTQSDNTNIFVNNEFTYLNIPIMMTTYFGNSNSKINFSIGPYADFLLENNLVNNNNFSGLDFGFNEERDNNFGYGIMVSTGLSFDFDKNSFQLLVSYNYNFDNLIDVESKNSAIPDISNFNTISISFVYLFNFLRSE